MCIKQTQDTVILLMNSLMIQCYHKVYLSIKCFDVCIDLHVIIWSMYIYFSIDWPVDQVSFIHWNLISPFHVIIWSVYMYFSIDWPVVRVSFIHWNLISPFCIHGIVLLGREKSAGMLMEHKMQLGLLWNGIRY